MMRIFICFMLALGFIGIFDADAYARNRHHAPDWHLAREKHDAFFRNNVDPYLGPWLHPQENHDAYHRQLDRQLPSRSPLGVRGEMEHQNLKDSVRGRVAPSCNPKERRDDWDSFCRLEAKHGRKCTPARFCQWQAERYR